MKQAHLLSLRKERERRGWSRNYIAEQIEVDIITVGRWERGERMPHPQYRQKLCDLFEMSAQDLGLFSEPCQPDHEIIDIDSSLKVSGMSTTTPDIPQSSEIDNITSVDSGTSQESDPSMNAMVITDLPQNTVSTYGKVQENSRPWSRHRRTVLIGLAGLGTLAFMGSRLLPMPPRTSAPIATLTAVPLSKRIHHFLDENGSNWINDLAWSPDGNNVAAATSINILPIWNIKKGIIVLYYPTLNGWINDVSWSKTNFIAAANADFANGSLQIWKFPQTTPVFTLKRAYSIRSVSWSPNDRYLAFSGHTPQVEVWDPFTPRMLSHYSDATLGLMGISRVKWSPSGTYLACVADNGKAHVWEALTGKPKTIYQKHRGRIHDLDWSPDERHIVSVGEDKTSHVWEAISGRTIQIYRGHTDIVEGVSWSPDGNSIATASADFTVHIWKPFTGKNIAIYKGYKSIVETVLWTREGTELAIGTKMEGFAIWQTP